MLGFVLVADRFERRTSYFHRWQTKETSIADGEYGVTSVCANLPVSHREKSVAEQEPILYTTPGPLLLGLSLANLLEGLNTFFALQLPPLLPVMPFSSSAPTVD